MQKTKRLLVIFLFLLLLYSLLRLIFYGMYFSKNNVSWKELATIVYWGWRMDITGLFYLNLVFFIYYYLLLEWIPVKRQRLVSVLLLSVLNIPLLAINIIDLAYYKFNSRRSTVDLFQVAADSLNAITSLWKAYWYLFLLFVVLSVVAISFFNRVLSIDPHTRSKRESGYLKSNLFPCLFFLLVSGMLARGFSKRPIIPSVSLLYLPASYQPLVNNSTITILYSLFSSQKNLKEKGYYPAGKLDTLFNIRRQLTPATPFAKKNVIVFILESFSREYVDEKDPLRAKTPFIDSLMAESIVCNNAFANGLESNKGIVALLAGLPPFFDKPFYYSNYSSNGIRGIGTLLKEEGYDTNFFMGTEYDHFGFARFSKMMGIDNYYSINDYGNPKHYDGNWGIFDHYFLPYAAKQLQQKNKPFLGVIFNISSHFPYTLPDSLKTRFTLPGQNAPQNSISYLDYSLRLFFDVIKNEPWYKYTVFVFSADHNIYWHRQEKASLYKDFRIPIFFHLPAENAQQQVNKPVQQLDIVPSILDMLHYDKPFMSFGRSVFDTTRGIVFNHFSDLYQALDSSYLFGYNEKEEAPAYLYKYSSDTALRYNLLMNGRLPDNHAAKLQEQLKAVIQRFNYSMIKNKLYIK